MSSGERAKPFFSQPSTSCASAPSSDAVIAASGESDRRKEEEKRNKKRREIKREHMLAVATMVGQHMPGETFDRTRSSDGFHGTPSISRLHDNLAPTFRLDGNSVMVMHQKACRVAIASPCGRFISGRAAPRRLARTVLPPPVVDPYGFTLLVGRIHRPLQRAAVSVDDQNRAVCSPVGRSFIVRCFIVPTAFFVVSRDMAWRNKTNHDTLHKGLDASVFTPRGQTSCRCN